MKTAAAGEVENLASDFPAEPRDFGADFFELGNGKK